MRVQGKCAEQTEIALFVGTLDTWNGGARLKHSFLCGPTSLFVFLSHNLGVPGRQHYRARAREERERQREREKEGEGDQLQPIY